MCNHLKPHVRVWKEGSLLWLAACTAHAVIRFHAVAGLVFKSFLGMLFTMVREVMGQGQAVPV